MFYELLILGGYGQFVWPAFIFTFTLCFMLYIKTKKALKEQEEAYLAVYKESQFISGKTLKEEKVVKEALSGSTI
tara:strand:- start:121 stop:345 length:225 start_codon:yes stop_codon:yes gene_type:complete